jgi:long-chain acyl-CoA synthetase
MAGLETLQELRRDFARRGEVAAITAFTEAGRESWSFARLGDVAARFAAGLVARDVKKGDSVALVAPNSARWIVAFWGVVAAGAVAVPLDAQTNDRDLASMIATASCRLLVTVAAQAERLRGLAPDCRLILLDAESTAAGEGWVGAPAAPRDDLPVAAPGDVAVIVFTSGTTGTPKAVPLTHNNLLTNVRALAATHLVGTRDRALLPLPLYHAYPLTIGMVTPFALGCGLVLPAGISGPELLAALRDGDATALLGVPRLYIALLENIERGIAAQRFPASLVTKLLLGLARFAWRRGLAWPGRILLRPLRRRLAPRLRLFVSGGAALKAEVEETLDALGWEVLTGYGLVETSSMLTFNPPGAAHPGTAGKPVPGMEVRIVRAGPDGVGEIEAHGPSLFSGYRGDDEKTRQAFTDDGWFRTGDLGFLDRDHFLHIAARQSETIVLADGKKLFPEEFEPAYAASLLIREVALLGMNGALVALVVPNLAAVRDVGTLRLGDALRDALAEAGSKLPSHARLSGFAIAREALPRTNLGKIRRHLLPQLYEAAQRPEQAAGAPELSPEDRALLTKPVAAALWRWLRQRFPTRSLTLDTVPQLDLGIDSLGWVELSLALERDLGLRLEESAIAKIITLRDLLRAAESSPRATTAVDEEKAPTLAPLGFWASLFRVLVWPLIRLTMRLCFSLCVEGLEHLPRGAALFCPNHVSYLDPFALGVALPRERLERTYWGGWSGILFNTVLRRFFSRAARVIPVDPDRAVSSGLAMGGEALKQGWNLVWFPEGMRSRDGSLLRFLPGIGVLLESRNVPVVPVYISGSFAAWPVARRWPRLRAITVRFGAPLDLSALLAKPPGRAREDEIADVIHDAVAKLGD